MEGGSKKKVKKERARTINNAHFSSLSLYRQSVDVPRSFLECRYYFGSLRPQKFDCHLMPCIPPNLLCLFCFGLFYLSRSPAFPSSLSLSLHLSMFLCLFFDYDSVPPPRFELTMDPFEDGSSVAFTILFL